MERGKKRERRPEPSTFDRDFEPLAQKDDYNLMQPVCRELNALSE